MPLAAGQVIHERYRIAALLGQGGMSEVYRAWDLSLKIPVAIKENLDTSSEAQQQFNEEALLLAHLSHPNLPRVTDFFSLPGVADYLVMDFIEGDDLDVMLDQAQTGGVKPGQANTSLPWTIIRPWIFQVCDALVYLHNQNPPIIHRDIKPGNIKITPEGRAVLVDFGIAKRYDPTKATFSGARAVTPGYSPPEQYGGAKTDARSDIYALGATLYHLLTGVTPPESVQRMAGSSAALSPRLHNPDISPELEQVIVKAMAAPMERRYQDVEGFKNALTAIQPTNFGMSSGGSAWMSQKPATAGLSQQNPVNIPGSVNRPAPIPVAPLPRQPYGITTQPKGRQSFFRLYWPILMLAGAALLVLVLILGRFVVQSGQPSSTPNIVVNVNVSASPPRATATSPIDSLIIKAAATQTAEASASASTPIQSPQPTPTLPVYPRRFIDTFRNNQNEWFTGIRDSLACWVAGGSYTCQTETGQPANHFQWLERFSLPAEFTLSADIWPGPDRPRSLADQNAGLVFRSTDQGRYLFSIRNDGAYRLSSIQTTPANWVDIIPWTYSEAIRRDRFNRLTVAGRGISYDLFINDQFVASFSDGLWVDGSPGLHLFTAPAEKPAIVEFDNFEFRAP